MLYLILGIILLPVFVMAELVKKMK